MFDKYKAEHDEMVKGELWVPSFRTTRKYLTRLPPPAQPRQEIHITLKDGSKKTGTSWETTPMDVAKEISKSLSERLVIAKVDGVLWDLERPLEGSVNLELLDFEHPEGPTSVSPCLSQRLNGFGRKAGLLAL